MQFHKTEESNRYIRVTDLVSDDPKIRMPQEVTIELRYRNQTTGDIVAALDHGVIPALHAAFPDHATLPKKHYTVVHRIGYEGVSVEYYAQHNGRPQLVHAETVIKEIIAGEASCETVYSDGKQSSATPVSVPTKDTPASWTIRIEANGKRFNQTPNPAQPWNNRD